MPEPSGEGTHPHLELIVEGISSERRKRRGFSGAIPDRKRRGEFAPKLEDAANRILSDYAKKTSPTSGIQPHLVFRVPIRKDNTEQSLVEHLTKVGLTVVSIEPDRACIAFQDEADLRKFQSSIDGYRNGPRQGLHPKTGKPYSSTSFDVLDIILADEMKLWDRGDRVGLNLQESIGFNGENIDVDGEYLVDIELWHAGSQSAVGRALAELTVALNQSTIKNYGKLDQYIGDGLILVRARITGGILNLLLDMDFVAEVETPPKPDLTPSIASSMTKADFPEPTPPDSDGPRVCVIDSGIVSSHPLLQANVGHEASVLTRVLSPADQHGHGTMVSGIAVFGDIRASYDARNFSSPVWLFSARVLNDQNEFDDHKLILTQMRDSVQFFKAAPYNCRVFNISIGGYKRPTIDLRGRQSEWAEALDRIARDEKVLIVIPSGNWSHSVTDNQGEAERLLREYPNYLLDSDSALTEPATAAIPITVGSLIQHESPLQSDGDRIVNLIGSVDQPSPFTRSGPGINGAIKPEFVHYGGGLVFHRFGPTARVSHESSTGIMSFSHQPTRQLFAYDFGSSLAAPRVANIAAQTYKALEKQFNEEPTPNLVRAVLASSSSVPPACSSILEPIRKDHAIVKVCGYGIPEVTHAIQSTDRRVTLVASRQIRLDHFDVFEVPIPDCFKHAKGKRRITVCLAYDPPVRARRYDYLGALMDMYLIKGKSISEIQSAFKKVKADENPEAAIPQKYRIALSPSSQARNCDYARKKSTLQKASRVWTNRESKKHDSGSSYFLVVRAERKWAPPEIVLQDYAVAVTLEANDAHLYAQVSLRVQARQRQRAMTKARVQSRG